MKSPNGQADLAYAQIKEAVLSGEFSAGQALSENLLAGYCNVSRTPVREAVQRLEMESVLVRSGRALFVPDPAPAEIYEIYETHGILTSAVSRLAAERRTELDLANLDQLVEEARRLDGAERAELIAFNLTFSRAVWGASHNRTLMAMLERTGMPVQRFGGSTTLADLEQWERARTHYEALRDAIAERDGERAAELSSQQAAVVRDARIRMWHARHREGRSAALVD